METRKTMSIEDRSPHIKRSRVNPPLKEKGYSSHYKRYGHHEATCWALHLDLLIKRNKKIRKTPPRETTKQAVV
jgi:hypothetical protein